ncbi:hypothetical protein ABXV18_24615 [Vibrio owensii]|uniref:hypothetical protein n=1 Tax=Vibrio owensii TaxID=696485 RepID=UPI00339AD69C
MAALGHDQKAFGLIKNYIKGTDDSDRARVRLSMPLKMTVKRYDGQYRNKLIDNTIPFYTHDAYISKRDELIVVMKPDYDNYELPIPSGMSDVEFVEMKMSVLGDRLSTGDFHKLMKEVGETTDLEVSERDAFSTPVNKEPYADNEEYGSW